VREIEQVHILSSNHDIFDENALFFANAKTSAITETFVTLKNIVGEQKFVKRP
jgi:hypothetical protein